MSAGATVAAVLVGVLAGLSMYSLSVAAQTLAIYSLGGVFIGAWAVVAFMLWRNRR